MSLNHSNKDEINEAFVQGGVKTGNRFCFVGVMRGKVRLSIYSHMRSTDRAQVQRSENLRGNYLSKNTLRVRGFDENQTLHGRWITVLPDLGQTVIPSGKEKHEGCGVQGRGKSNLKTTKTARLIS
ncbi:hypothetical protein RUM44_012423 [Polyplax serrata]|uniref:Uncharacterized protein n=1 Tax=Polyplax serrata TaxID=468196 RepID=A0ABR1BB87_POLSC